MLLSCSQALGLGSVYVTAQLLCRRGEEYPDLLPIGQQLAQVQTNVFNTSLEL